MICRGPVSALVVGHLTHDRYGAAIAAGGSAFYAARTLRALGAAVTVVTARGSDYRFSNKLGDVQQVVIESRTTTLFENTYPELGPRKMRVSHPAAPVTPDVLKGRPQNIDVAFLAPVVGEVLLEEWIDYLSKNSAIIGVGLQGFLKQQGPGADDTNRGSSRLVKKRFEPDDAVLRRIDAAFLSREDIEGYGSDSLMARLCCNVPLVAVTDGEKGAVVYEKERAFHVGTLQVDATDPTGAGDTFPAAFLFALARSRTTKSAARLAAAAAGKVVEGVGSETIDRVASAVVDVANVPVRDL
jgi:1D-myo-inositol 3-kinase